MRFSSLGLVVVVVAATACGAGSDAGSAPGGGVTFGGAQDIGELRSILDRGEIPGPKTLDANGFFNEHYAPPPPASCGGRLCVSAGLAVGRAWLDDRHQATLQIALSTNVDPAELPRLPMRLVVVVDHSGSMASDGRLEKVKAGLLTLIDNLEDEDRLAILSFDDVVTIDAPFAPTLDRPALRAVVQALQPRGGTNIHDGLRAGLDLLGDEPQSDRQNRVIFLSDGLATVGITAQSAIIEMATSRITRGIGLTTIGVGNDFDAPLMRGLAERGAGNFYYLEDAAAADEVFVEELDYFMSPLALELQIEATAGSGWRFGKVTGTSLWTATAASGNMKIPAVFLASRVGENPGPGGGRRGGGSTLFIDLQNLSPGGARVAELTLSYRLPGEAERITDTLTLDYDRDPTETPDEPYLSYSGMAERYAMYNAYLGLEAATRLAESNYTCAAAALRATRRNGGIWLAAHESDQDLAADLALIDKFLGNLQEHGAGSSDNVAGCPDVSGEDWDEHPQMYGCAAAGGGAGGAGGALVLVGLALVVARRRRRA